MSEKFESIENPHRRVVEDLKIRNINNKKVIASEYFGSKYTYDDTFNMFELLLHLLFLLLMLFME